MKVNAALDKIIKASSTGKSGSIPKKKAAKKKGS